MTARRPLDDFLAHELSESIRAQLLTAIEDLHQGRRYFTFNTVNVLLDADSSTATVEDELDPEREDRLELRAFADLLRGRGTT